MNARELVHAALKDEEKPRPVCGPLAVHFCARHAGVPVREYTLNADRLAESVIAYWETFRPDAIWVSSDTWVTAEAMGAPVAFVEGESPMAGTGGPAVRTLADLDNLPLPDPARQGRQPLMLDALRQVREAVGDEAFVVACFDQAPFSLACAVAGLENVMTAAVTDPEFVAALLGRCTEYAIAYGQAMAACGPDMLSMGDSPAIMLGPARYREIALPHEQCVIRSLRETTDCPLSLHICGDTTAFLPDMVRSGADVLEVDHLLDLEQACAVVPDGIALWGNLDPVRVLCQGTADDVTAACGAALRTARHAGRSRFVLSSGCTLAPDTPADNVHALVQSVHNAQRA